MQIRFWLTAVLCCVVPLSVTDAAGRPAKRGGKGKNNGANSILLKRQMQQMQMKKQQMKAAASNPQLHQKIMLARQRELAQKEAHEHKQSLASAPQTEEDRELQNPRWIAPIVTWLASEQSAAVTGRVFEASGRSLAVAEGWVRGPQHEPIDDPTQLGPVVAELLAAARPNSGMNGVPGGPPQPRPGK